MGESGGGVLVWTWRPQVDDRVRSKIRTSAIAIGVGVAAAVVLAVVAATRLSGVMSALLVGLGAMWYSEHRKFLGTIVGDLRARRPTSTSVGGRRCQGLSFRVAESDARADESIGLRVASPAAPNAEARRRWFRIGYIAVTVAFMTIAAVSVREDGIRAMVLSAAVAPGIVLLICLELDVAIGRSSCGSTAASSPCPGPGPA